MLWAQGNSTSSSGSTVKGKKKSRDKQLQAGLAGGSANSVDDQEMLKSLSVNCDTVSIASTSTTQSSFRNLARKYLNVPEDIPASQITLLTTSFDSYDQLMLKYPECHEILAAFSRFPNVHVLHGINAWELSSHFSPVPTDSETKTGDWKQGQRTVGGQVEFDTIGWNHPHLGTEDFRLHRFLMAHFFHSVAYVLKSNVIISLVEGQETRWDLIGQAARSGLILDEGSPVKFDERDWDGYVAKRNKHGKSFKNAATQRRHGNLMRSNVFRFVPTAQLGQALEVGEVVLDHLPSTEAESLPPLLVNIPASRPEQPVLADPAAPSTVALAPLLAPASLANPTNTPSPRIPRTKQELKSFPLPTSLICPYCQKPMLSPRSYRQHVLQIHILCQQGADWKPNRPKVFECRGSNHLHVAAGTSHSDATGEQAQQDQTTLDPEEKGDDACGKFFRSDKDRVQHEIARHLQVEDPTTTGSASDPDTAAATLVIPADSTTASVFGAHASDYDYVPCDVCGQSVARREWGMRVHLESLKPAVGMELKCPCGGMDFGGRDEGLEECRVTFIEARAMFQHFRFCYFKRNRIQ